MRCELDGNLDESPPSCLRLNRHKNMPNAPIIAHKGRFSTGAGVHIARKHEGIRTCYTTAGWGSFNLEVIEAARGMFHGECRVTQASPAGSGIAVVRAHS